MVDLRELDVRAGDGDGGAHVEAGGDGGGEDGGREVPPGVEGDDALGVGPAWLRGDGDGGLG